MAWRGNVLAYLTMAPPLESPGSGSDQEKPSNLHGSWESNVGAEAQLQQFSQALLGGNKDENATALREQWAFDPDWDSEDLYDTVNPCGDPRWTIKDVWTFDFLNDVLVHMNEDRCSQIPFSCLRKRIVSFTDMQYLCESVPQPVIPILPPETPDWTPRIQIDKRVRQLTQPLLKGFRRHWRHVFRNRYSSMTLRVVAKAIIRLATLDFEVYEENDSSRQLYAYRWVAYLPRWEPFKFGLTKLGRAWLVVCETVQEGLSIAQKHVSHSFDTLENTSSTGSGQEQPHYIILTVKHIMLCHATNPTSLIHTTPEPLFNGDDETAPPSDRALDYLLWATSSARPSVTTSLRLPPVEIQDMILSHVSLGSVKAAHIGCMINLGSPFTWKDGAIDVEMLEKDVPKGTQRVQSLIQFGAYQSGLDYIAFKPK